MKNKFKKTTIASIINTTMILIIGVLLLFKATVDNNAIIVVMSVLIGIEVIISAVKIKIGKGKYVLKNYDKFFNVINVIIALFIIINPFKLEHILTTGFGIYVITRGIAKISSALILKENNQDIWLVAGSNALLLLTVGIIILINPFKEQQIINQMIGTFTILYSVLEFTNIKITKKYQKYFVKWFTKTKT